MVAAVTICSDFGAQKNKVSHCFLCFPICLPWNDWMGAMIFVFWMLSFKPIFSLSSFAFIKGLFSSSLLSACVSEVIIFLPEILIPACDTSSLAFYVMYSAYILKKQGDNIQPWRTPFPIWNQSVVPYPVLTVASWLATRFLRTEVRWSDIPITLKIFHSLLRFTQS